MPWSAPSSTAVETTRVCTFLFRRPTRAPTPWDKTEFNLRVEARAYWDTVVIPAKLTAEAFARS